MKREIIEIDEEKCNGCGECIPACPEGALQIIDGKARLVNEAYCDGLGACIGECPNDAISIEEREAKSYDEKAVAEEMLEQGEEVLKAHLEHLEEHGQDNLLEEALDYLEKQDLDISLQKFKSKSEDSKPESNITCPSSEPRELKKQKERGETGETPSRLEQWPVQLSLVPTEASFFDGSELLIVADCVPFAYGGFHDDFLGDNAVVIGCPKFDDAEFYSEKLGNIIKQNDISKIKIVHMEVPCCFGLKKIVENALSSSGKKIEVDEVTVGVDGELK